MECLGLAWSLLVKLVSLVMLPLLRERVRPALPCLA